jgi:glycerate dehydrogenase
MSARIVVLDGYCINPGDLSWDALQEFGSVTVFDRTATNQAALRAAGATILLTSKTPLPADVLAQLPSLRYIGVIGTG